MTPRCSLCHALRPAAKLAPYYVGDVRRLACEFAGCREAARIELRTGITIDDERRVA